MQREKKKNKSIYLLLTAIVGFAVLIFIYFKVFDRNKPDELFEETSEPVLGVYNRDEKMPIEKTIALKHFVLTWFNSNEEISVEKRISTVLQTNQDILLTIEMWSQSDKAYSRHGVLQGMIDGDYDKKTTGLCKALSASPHTFYVRWNPDMEVPEDKYQWQNQSSDLYIAAFRHFAILCKRFASNVKIVWGPSGYAGSLEYWPGADVTDFASITLKNTSGWLASKYPGEKFIPVQLERKLHRLRFIDKPVLLLGSKEVSQNSFDTNWLYLAEESIKKDTEIIYSRKNFVRPHSAEIRTANSKLLLGVYDPNQKLIGEPAVTTEHIFCDWGNIQDGSFKKRFNEVIARNHDVIVTVEPWKSKTHPNDKDVLNSTLKGDYDDAIRELYNIISNVRQTVYLRWAHEMEIPVDRYAWQNQDPVTYIKAYRYVMNFNKIKAKNIRNVWGPTGDRGALDWWPGNDVVDFISIAIYGLPNKDITDPEKLEAFSTIFKRKYNRMRFVNKPVFITEFGVKGTQEYKRNWLRDAAATINNTPQIVGACYFNFSDVPKAWGKIEPPDWSLTKETFERFTSELKK